MHAVILNSGPLGLLTNPLASAANYACGQWLQGLIDHGVLVIVPEIIDYEIRRELLRLNRHRGIDRLNEFNASVTYLPITTSVMRQAAIL